MVDRAIIRVVKGYIAKLKEAGIPISFGVVFGSYAKGRANKYSDIDLLIVSQQFDGIVSREVVNTLWRIAARTDSRIEPIPCGYLQWQNDASNPIIEVARCEGEKIELSEEEIKNIK